MKNTFFKKVVSAATVVNMAAMSMGTVPFNTVSAANEISVDSLLYIAPLETIGTEWNNKLSMLATQNTVKELDASAAKNIVNGLGNTGEVIGEVLDSATSITLVTGANEVSVVAAIDNTSSIIAENLNKKIAEKVEDQLAEQIAAGTITLEEAAAFSIADVDFSAIDVDAEVEVVVNTEDVLANETVEFSYTITLGGTKYTAENFTAYINAELAKVKEQVKDELNAQITGVDDSFVDTIFAPYEKKVSNWVEKLENAIDKAETTVYTGSSFDEAIAKVAAAAPKKLADKYVLPTSVSELFANSKVQNAFSTLNNTFVVDGYTMNLNAADVETMLNSAYDIELQISDASVEATFYIPDNDIDAQKDAWIEKFEAEYVGTEDENGVITGVSDVTSEKWIELSSTSVMADGTASFHVEREVTPVFIYEDETTTEEETTTEADETDPAEDETTTAGEDETTTAGEGETTTAGEGETTTAGEEETTTAGEGETTTAGEGETTTAGEEETTTADLSGVVREIVSIDFVAPAVKNYWSEDDRAFDTTGMAVTATIKTTVTDAEGNVTESTETYDITPYVALSANSASEIEYTACGTYEIDVTIDVISLDSSILSMIFSEISNAADFATWSDSFEVELALRGDTNHDDIVDTDDAVEILKAMNEYMMEGAYPESLVEDTHSFTAADINEDGILDSDDATLILKYSALSIMEDDVTWKGVVENYPASVIRLCNEFNPQ